MQNQHRSNNIASNYFVGRQQKCFGDSSRPPPE